MSIYDLDFDQFVVNMLPPDKRLPVEVNYLQDAFTAVQSDHDALFTSYRGGSAAGPYNPFDIYNLDDQVIYLNGVYESVVDGNTSLPSDTDNWVLIQQNFIGVVERITYTGQVIRLTYALNKWFGTVFRQPPLLSDIYIVNGIIIKIGFRIGIDEPDSSTVGLTGSSDDVGSPTPFAQEVGFVIYIPVAVYDALNPVDANRISIVQSFVDLYVPAGITFKIQTY